MGVEFRAVGFMGYKLAQRRGLPPHSNLRIVRDFNLFTYNHFADLREAVLTGLPFIKLGHGIGPKNNIGIDLFDPRLKDGTPLDLELTGLPEEVRPDLIDSIAKRIIFLSNAVPTNAKSGHMGGSVSKAFAYAALFLGDTVALDHFRSSGRIEYGDDMVGLLAGHVSPLLYATRALFDQARLMVEGTEHQNKPWVITPADLLTFRNQGSKLTGHVEADKFEQCWFAGTSGGAAPNMLQKALIARKLGLNIWVVAIEGDAAQSPGVVSEVIDIAATQELKNMTLYIDNNQYGIDNATAQYNSDLAKKYLAAGWNVIRIDGLDATQCAVAWQLARKLANDPTNTQPTVIIGESLKGAMSPKEGTPAHHGAPPAAVDVAPLGPSLIGLDVDPTNLGDAIKAAVTGMSQVEAQYINDMLQRNANRAPNDVRVVAEKITANLKKPVDPIAALAHLALANLYKTDGKPSNTRSALATAFKEVEAVSELVVRASADLEASFDHAYKPEDSISPTNPTGVALNIGIREATLGGITSMGMPVIPIIGQDGQVHYTRILYKAGTYIPFARIMDVYRRMSHIEVELLNRIANKYGLRAIDLFYVVTLGHLDATLDGPTHQATGEVSAFENSLPGSYAMLPTDYNETLAMLAHAASLSPLRPVGVVASREPWPVISLSARDPKLAAQGGYVLDDYQDREIGQRNSDHDNLLIMAAGGLIVDSLWKEVIPRLRQENSLNVRLAVGSSPYLFFNDRPNDAVEQSKAAVWNDGQITQTVAFAPVDPGFLSRFTLGNNSLWQTSFGVTQFGDTATAQQLNRMHGLDAETMYAKAVLFAQQRARREQLMRGA